MAIACSATTAPWLCGLGWIRGSRGDGDRARESDAISKSASRNFWLPAAGGLPQIFCAPCVRAEKFSRPVWCLVDTQGAFCGNGGRGSVAGNAIADNLLALAGLRVRPW